MNAAATLGDKRSVRKTLFFVGTWGLSFVCLAWVLHDIDFTSLLDNVEHMHWGWVAVAMIADVLVYLASDAAAPVSGAVVPAYGA